MKINCKTKSYTLSLAALALLSYGCSSSGTTSSTDEGGGNTNTTTQVAITSVDDLPKATSPVLDGSSTAALITNGIRNLATTGMPLGSLTSSSFNSTHSIAACEMYNMTKHAISSSVQGDLTQCYVTKMLGSLDTGTTFDDGNYHIAALDVSATGEEEAEGAPSKIKFKISKNSSGNITSFELFACKNSTQAMYVLQNIDGTNYTMLSKNTGNHIDHQSGLTRQFRDSVTVTGTLNSSGAFVDEVGGTPTPKTIQMNFTDVVENQENFFGVVTYNQSSDSADILATMSGTHVFHGPNGNENCTFTNLISGATQLIDSRATPYVIGDMRLGDGSVKYSQSGGCGSFTHSETGTESWSGDTKAVIENSASAFFSDIENDTLTAAESPTVSFEGNQVWDCSGDAETTITLTSIETGPISECNNLELPHNHIDCWQIVREGQEDRSSQENQEGSGGSGGGQGGGSGGGSGGNSGGGGSGGQSGGSGGTQGGGQGDITACGGLSESSPINSDNLTTLCTCNGGSGSDCSFLNEACSGLSNIGACITAVNSQ